MQPTAFAPAVVEPARELLLRIWRPGFCYRKAGVTLLDLAPERPEQGNLNLFETPDPSKRVLMTALDAVNGRFGSGTLGVAGAASGMGRRTEDWQMAQSRRSPSYTTNWGALAQTEA